MNEKNNLILAAALLTVFVSSNVSAATEQQALSKLDGSIVNNSELRVEARTQLSELVKGGIPVDHAYEIVSSAVEKKYTPREIRKISSEVISQVEDGIPADQVVRMADHAIDSGYSAKDTKKILNTFEKRVDKGMSANDAYVLSKNEFAMKSNMKHKGSNNVFRSDSDIIITK